MNLVVCVCYMRRSFRGAIHGGVVPGPSFSVRSSALIRPSIRLWLAWLPCRRRGSFLSILLLLFGLLGPRCCRFCSQHDSALVPYALDWVPCAVCAGVRLYLFAPRVVSRGVLSPVFFFFIAFVLKLLALLSVFPWSKSLCAGALAWVCDLAAGTRVCRLMVRAAAACVRARACLRRDHRSPALFAPMCLDEHESPG